jgi:flagellar motility protein MotE (MotC chaperone)
MYKFFVNPRTLMSLVILVGAAVLCIRVGDVWDSITTGRLLAPEAHAENKTDAPAVTPPSFDATKAADTKARNDASAPPPVTDSAGNSNLAAPTDEDTSPAEMEVLKQLSNRREELEKRTKALDTREALIKIAEQRVDNKIKEMQTLRLQLQSMISQVSEAQATQLDNLVKVYETMKPEDAAKIMETLDMPILLNVIQRMKPKSTAPIMAKMNTEKAKDITVALTKQDQLPQVK